MLELVHSWGYDFQHIRALFKPNIIKKIPFHSYYKSTMTLVDNNRRKFAYVSGASAFVFGNCSHYLDASGTRVNINQ